MKDKIVGCLSDKSHPSMSIIEINDKLGLNSAEELKMLQDEIKKLEETGTIYYSSKKKKYILMNNTHFLQGKLILNEKGYGFIEIENNKKDVYIHENNINGACNGDVVLIEMTNIERNEGKIVRIIKKDESNIIGEFIIKDNKYYVKADNKKNGEYEIPEDKTMNAVEGHKVVIKKIPNTKFLAEVVAIIGHKNDVGVDILSFVYEHNFHPQFEEAVLNEVDELPSEVLDTELKGRLDLRNEMIFTIDGDDTKDIDDAISVKKNNDNTYELGVHIADVSHYVKKGSKIDEEAFFRGTSVYLVDRVVPMLPHKLSNGICSLNPNVDRLALSCVMTIDINGKVLDKKIFTSVIRSRKQMTYNCVNDILEKNIIREDYDEFVDTLHLMKELSDILRKKMIRKGYLDFDKPEAKIIVDEMCHPIEIKLRTQRTGEQLIENFMIVANESVSEYITDMELPCIYRVHDKPNPDKLKRLLTILSLKGIVFKADINKIKSYDYQKLLKSLEGVKGEHILTTLAIQSMSKAKYSEENIGHFGLGSTAYSHFTSPIRRYPDLTLHRLIKDYTGSYSNEVVEKWERELPGISMQTSIKEQDSIDCERDVEKMKKAEYMEDHIGEEYIGVVSGVSAFGLFVELENTVEGLIKIEDLPSDYYIYDETILSLTGRKPTNRFTFGDVLKVKAIRASRVTSNVDFTIVKEQDNGKKKKKEG